MNQVSKNTKIILFTSLIILMILPFSGMDFAEAKESVIVDWDKTKNNSSFNNGVSIGKTPKISSSSNSKTTFTQCVHGANLTNKCYGTETSGKFYYSTPNSYARVDVCNQSWNCADLDFRQIAPSQIIIGAYVYTFESATYRACAPVYGVCTSPVMWPSSYGLVVSHNNIPTDTPITHYTTYKYENHGSVIMYLVVNGMNIGYVI